MKKYLINILVRLLIVVTLFTFQYLFPGISIAQTSTFNEINLNPEFSGTWQAKLKIRNQLPLNVYCGPNCDPYCPETIQNPITSDCSCLCGAKLPYNCYCKNNEVKCDSFCMVSCPKHFFKSCVETEVDSEDTFPTQFVNTRKIPKCCTNTLHGTYCPEEVSCISRFSPTLSPKITSKITISFQMCIKDGMILLGGLIDNNGRSTGSITSQTIISENEVIAGFRIAADKFTSAKLTLLDDNSLKIQFEDKDSFVARKVTTAFGIILFCPSGTSNTSEIGEEG